MAGELDILMTHKLIVGGMSMTLHRISATDLLRMRCKAQSDQPTIAGTVWHLHTTVGAVERLAPVMGQWQRLVPMGIKTLLWQSRRREIS